jgi:hypothetical protein
MYVHLAMATLKRDPVLARPSSALDGKADEAGRSEVDVDAQRPCKPETQHTLQASGGAEQYSTTSSMAKRMRPAGVRSTLMPSVPASQKHNITYKRQEVQSSTAVQQVKPKTQTGFKALQSPTPYKQALVCDVTPT